MVGVVERLLLFDVRDFDEQERKSEKKHETKKKTIDYQIIIYSSKMMKYRIG